MSLPKMKVMFNRKFEQKNKIRGQELEESDTYLGHTIIIGKK